MSKQYLIKYTDIDDNDHEIEIMAEGLTHAMVLCFNNREVVNIINIEEFYSSESSEESSSSELSGV